MPPQEPLPTNGGDRKSRLAAAVRKERLKAAAGGMSSPPSVGAPKIDSNLERITGRASPNEPTVNIPYKELGDEWRPGRGAAFTQNAANAATFGNYDKLAALIPGEGTYEERRQRVRDVMSMEREDHPVTSFGGDVAGFLTPGGVIAKGVGILARPVVNLAQRASPMLGFFSKIGSAGAQGAVAGGAYGATVGAENLDADNNRKVREAAGDGRTEVELEGPANPTSLEGRLRLAGDYAPMGAVLGGGMQAAGPVLRPLVRSVRGTIAKVGDALKLTPGSAQRFNEKVGREAVQRSLERAGILTIEDFMKRAAKYGDKPVVTGELTQDSLNSLVALVRSKGTTADKAMAVLEDRIAGLPGRMLKDIAEETGLKPDEVFGEVEKMIKAGRARAAPAYEAAEAAPFAETANLERIVRDAPILRGLFSKAQNRVQNQAVPQIGQADQMPPLKVYDELKQLVDEEINKRISLGQGIDDIQGVREELVRELDLISGQAATGAEVPPAGSSLYAAAREAGGDAPKAQAGLKAGERALSGAKLAEDVEREVAALTGGQLTAYQAGVIRTLAKEVENGRLTPRRVKTSAFRQKMESAFGKPAADGLVRRFLVEADLLVKGSRWNPNVGSVTSQAQMGQPTRFGDELVRGAANVMSGNKIGLFTQLASVLRRQGYSESQLNEIGRIYLSSPNEASKLLFPGKTPRPGSVPPATPPAGQVRENKPASSVVQFPRGGKTPPQVEAPKPPSQSSGGTRPEETARLQRAKEQGFDTENTYYHGTNEAGELRAGSDGFLFVTKDPNVANTYARSGKEGGNVRPLMIRGKIMPGKEFDKLHQKYSTEAEAFAEAKRRGFDGVEFSEETILFDAKNARSKFDEFGSPPPSPPGSGRTGEVLRKARAQGFNTDRVFYHGSKADIVGDLKPSEDGYLGRGVYLTDEEMLARHHATEDGGKIYRVAIRGKVASPEAFDAAYDKAERITKGNGNTTEVAKRILKGQGYNAVEYNSRHGNEVVVFDPKNARLLEVARDTPTEPTRPPPPGSGKGPPAATSAKGPPATKQVFHTRASIKDAPKEYRDVVMNAPEGSGISQLEWTKLRNLGGLGWLPTPRALGIRIDNLTSKRSLSREEARALRAMQEMKKRLEDLPFEYKE